MKQLSDINLKMPRSDRKIPEIVIPEFKNYSERLQWECDQKNSYKGELTGYDCPDCYTIAEFAEDNPHGKFILATGSHVVAVSDGNYYDTWDSGEEIPVYYWSKEA